MKKVICLAVCFLLLFSLGITAAADDDISILLDGRKLKPDVPPMLIESRTMVPIRVIANALGLSVGWEEAEEKITLKNADKEIILYVNKAGAYVNNEEYLLDSPPTIVNSRTLVPVRFISENLNCVVAWEDHTKTVFIESVISEVLTNNIIEYNEFLGVPSVASISDTDEEKELLNESTVKYTYNLLDMKTGDVAKYYSLIEALGFKFNGIENGSLIFIKETLIITAFIEEDTFNVLVINVI